MLKNTAPNAFEIYWNNKRYLVNVGENIDITEVLEIDSKDVADIEKVLLERYPSLQPADSQSKSKTKDNVSGKQ